jgi:osmotically-inducible protein OsmY
MSRASAVPLRCPDVSSPDVSCPDASVTGRVRAALYRSGYADLRSVDVKSAPRGVRLQGTVHSYYLKQIAQFVALSTDGVDAVDNQMEVA